MALPPKGDPRRPLHLAVRSMRLLGGILLLFTTCGGIYFAMTAVNTGARGMGMPPVWAMSLGLMVYLLPGLAFVILAMYVKQRQSWAVIAAICLAGIGALFMLIGLIGLSVVLFQKDAPQMVWIPFGVAALILLALVQLIYHLARSFAAIRYIPPDERGFEPLMAEPYVPPLPSSPDDVARPSDPA